MELEPVLKRFPVEIVDCQIVWPKKTKDSFNRLLNRVKNREVDILVDELREQRTIKQNSLYWLRNRALELWNDSYDKNGYHVIMMQRAGFGKFITFDDMTLWCRDSSAGLNTKQMSQLFDEQDAVARFLSEDGVGIELPTKENWKKYG